MSVATRRQARVSPPQGTGAGRYDSHLEAAVALLPEFVSDETWRTRAEAWLREMRASHPLWLIKEPTSKLATIARLRTQPN